MHFQISRNGQMYGPYTLDDLQRYVASGNVLPNDLAKSDEMADWVQVSQLLATPPAPVAYAQPAAAATYAPVYAQPVVVNPALAASPYPDAPNLHWGLTVLFSVLTCFTIFTFIWDVVIAIWLRRVQPEDKSLFWYGAAFALYVVKYFVALTLVGTALAHGAGGSHFLNGSFEGLAAISKLFSVAILGIIISGNFVKRASLLEHFNGPEPVGLELDPVMTFFFAPWYFQYHLNRINALKAAARYSGQPAF